MANYKQRCSVCKNKWALVRSGRQKFVVCEECEMKVVSKPLEISGFKKMFDIPMEWYKENPFLRSIRYQYGRFGNLTERQIESFKETIKEMKKEAKKKKSDDKKKSVKAVKSNLSGKKKD